MNDAFTKHKIYEHPEIRDAATDPDFMANIHKSKTITNKALEENNDERNMKDILYHLRSHTNESSRKQIYA